MYEFIHQLNYQQQIYEWTYKGLRGIILQVSRLNETHKSLELYILLGNAAMSDKYPGGIEPQPIKLEFKFILLNFGLKIFWDLIANLRLGASTQPEINLCS